MTKFMDNFKPHECKLCGTIRNSIATFVCHFNKVHATDVTMEVYCEQYLKYDRPKCLFCDNVSKFISYSKGFGVVCNDKKCQDKYTGLRSRESMMEAYGVEYASQLPDYLDKCRKSKLERYGDENYVNVDKARKTNLERYGVEHYIESDEFKQQYRETCLEKYGVDHHAKSDEFKDKMKDIWIERYGVDCPLKTPEVKDKIRATTELRYGGFTFKSTELREKVKSTMLDRYGVENPQQNSEIRQKTENTNIERYGSKSALQNESVLMRLYGVRHAHEIDGVLEKQKVNRKKSLNDKYGVDNVSQLDWVQEIIRTNNLEKYGVEYPIQLDSVKQKQRNTNLLRYGVESVMQCPEIYLRQQAAVDNSVYKIKSFVLKCGREIHYQSGAELVFILKCESMGIEIYDGDVVMYDMDNVSHRYYVDFKIKEPDGKFRLIEIKKKHKWWYESIESGVMLAKCKAVQAFSSANNYHPYKIIF